MTQVLQTPVVERKSRKKYPGLYASICSQTWWCACSPLPSCRVRVARQGRKIRFLKCPAEDDLRKNLSHSACGFRSGPRSNRACQRGGCNCDTRAYSADERAGRLGEDSPEKGQDPCLWAGLPWSALE